MGGLPYHLQNPDVTFNIHVAGWDNLLALLHEEKIEYFIADIREIPDDSQLAINILASPSIGFYCHAGHPLHRDSGTEVLDPQVLRDYPLASVAIPIVVKEEIRQELGLDDKPFQIDIECDDLLLLKNLLPGTNIILLCATQLVSQPEQEHFKQLNVPMQHRQFGTWGLVRKKGKEFTPAAASLCEQLCQHIVKMSEL